MKKPGRKNGKFRAAPAEKRAKSLEKKAREKKRDYMKTGIKGLDELFEHGIPKGVSVLVAGGTGSGKTILCLQILANAAREGRKCLFMSFEESEDRLREHMEDFGWPAREFERQGRLMIKRFSSFDIAKSIDALLAKERGELLIDYTPVILPKGFVPDFVVVDSLSAISSAFIGKEDNYRSYVEQLFRYFEGMDSTVFLITETEQIPTVFSRSGVEEFLADGVMVLYNIRKGNVRESAIEVLKMRGARHKKRIVAMQILNDVGVEIYPEQEVFSKI
jgi:KaiC/GvpD/RAD55 family RecA-like ATPase